MADGAIMAFYATLNDFQTHGQAPVDHRGGNKHFHMFEILVAQCAGQEHQFPNTDDRHQRAIFEHGNELVAGGWNDQRHGLRQNNTPHG